MYLVDENDFNVIRTNKLKKPEFVPEKADDIHLSRYQTQFIMR